MTSLPSYKLLRQMASSHETYWDRDIAKYLIDKTGADYLEQHIEYQMNWKNFTISSNLWGYVNLNNLYSLYKDNKQTGLEAINEWRNALSQVYPLETPCFIIKKSGQKNIEIGINGLLCLQDTTKWFDMYCTDPDKYRLSKNEKNLLASELLELEQYNNLYNFNLDTRPLMVEFLVNILADYIAEKPKEDFTNKILNSKSIKEILKSAKTEDIQQLFSSDSLKNIIKKSHIKETMATSPHLLSNLMPIAKAEAWVTEGFNLITFLGPVLRKASGYTLTDMEKQLKGQSISVRDVRGSSRAAEEIVLRLDYIQEPLKKIIISEKDVDVFYMGVLYSKNKELFKKALSIIDFPKLSSKNSFLYDLFDIPVKLREEKFLWTDVLKEYKSEELHKKLNYDLEDKKNIVPRVKI